MKLWTRIAFIVLFVPLIATAQFRDLDGALQNLESGFGNGDVQAIVAGVANGDQVMLQFPGLVDQTGFFGRDQAGYLLDGLFNKVKPSGYKLVKTAKVSAERQYQIIAKWTIESGGQSEARDLYITLRQKDDRWAIVSIRSAGK